MENKDLNRIRMVLVEKHRTHCAHSGKCSTCNGKGYYYSSFGLTKTVDCPNCDGFKTGRCRHCHGTGTITKTEQVYE